MASILKVESIQNPSAGSPSIDIDSSGNITFTGAVTKSGGTANGVLYLNGSGVETSGSALTFDGTKQTIGSATSQNSLFKQIIGSGGANEGLVVVSGATGKGWLGFNNGNTGSIPGQVTYDFSSGLMNVFSSGSLSFTTNASGTAATIDSSGNLGLGVTPSAWTYFKPLQAVRSAFAGSSGQTMTGYNVFYDGSYKYIASDYALKYAQNATTGAHTWDIAASGTAGNAITFTQAMTLDASGNLTLSGGQMVIPDTKYYLFGTGYAGMTGNGSNSSAGYLAFACGPGGSERARIDSSGNLLVGTTTSTAKLTSVAGSAKIGLYVEGYLASNPTAYIYRDNTDGQYGLWIRHDAPLIGSGGTGYMIQFQDRNGGALGSITSSGAGAGSTAYNTSSDYRLKNFVVPMVGALAKVSLLKPVTFKWHTDNSDGQGFIAHELQEVFPEAVTGVKDDVDDEGKPVYQGIDTSFLVATLTAAIQELKAENDVLKARLDAAGL